MGKVAKMVGRDFFDAVLEQAQTIKIVSLDLLDRNPVQPPGREKSAIRELADDIKKTGILSPPVVVVKRTRFTVIDGHRRIEAARLIGMPEIACQVVDSDLSPAMLFLRLNRSIKRVSSEQWFWAWATEDPEDRAAFLSQIPGPTRSGIEEMCRIFGVDGALHYATAHDKKLSPHISHFINMAGGLIVARGLPAVQPLEKIGHWLIKWEQAGAVNALSRDPHVTTARIKRLRAKIVADEPLVSSRSRSRAVVKEKTA